MDLPAVVAAPANPHFARLGGAGAVTRLVEAFYRHMGTRDDARRILAMHPADLSHTRQILVAYLTEWTGGPRLYTPWRGPPRLGRVHAPFAIGPADRDAWMRCMDAALDECVPDAALRAELHAAFSKLAAHLTRHPDPVPTDVPSPDPGAPR